MGEHGLTNGWCGSLYTRTGMNFNSYQLFFLQFPPITPFLPSFFHLLAFFHSLHSHPLTSIRPFLFPPSSPLDCSLLTSTSLLSASFSLPGQPDGDPSLQSQPQQSRVDGRGAAGKHHLPEALHAPLIHLQSEQVVLLILRKCNLCSTNVRHALDFVCRVEATDAI